MCDEYDKWIEGKELRLSEFNKLQARLKAAEAVCESIKDYWDTPGEHLPIEIERSLDNWRKVKKEK